METYNPCESDTPSIEPVHAKLAIYQLLVQQERGEIDFQTEFHPKLILWARFNFQFGRDKQGNIVVTEPEKANT